MVGGLLSAVLGVAGAAQVRQAGNDDVREEAGVLAVWIKVWVEDAYLRACGLVPSRRTGRARPNPPGGTPGGWIRRKIVG